jgi:hypothetical protein
LVCFFGFLAVFLSAGAGGRRDAPPDAPRRAWRGLAVATCLVWLPPIAWYHAIVDSRRLLFPVFAVLLPPALDALARLAPAAWAASAAARLVSGFGRRAAWPFAAACLAGSVALAVAHGNPREERHVDDSTLAIARRLSRPEYGDAVVLAKPSRTVPPDWMVFRGATLLAIPRSVSDADAPAWIAERAGYVLVSPGLLANRRGLVGPWASWDEQRGLVPQSLPPWLAEEHRDPSVPSRYWLLRVVGR